MSITRPDELPYQIVNEEPFADVDATKLLFALIRKSGGSIRIPREFFLIPNEYEHINIDLHSDEVVLTLRDEQGYARRAREAIEDLQAWITD